MIIVTFIPKPSKKIDRKSKNDIKLKQKRRDNYLLRLREYRIMEFPNPVTMAGQARSKSKIEKHLSQFSKTKRAQIERKLKILYSQHSRKSSRKSRKSSRKSSRK